MTKLLAACALALAFYVPALSQSDYSNYQQQTARINSLAKANPNLVQVKSIAKTSGGKDIWMLTIGTGGAVTKPAIAVVGGVSGNHLLGTELAIGFAEQLLRSPISDSVKKVLDATTYYVFPNMSPDAMEQYFGKLKYERQGNAKATDDDRDGKDGEDEYDDLDGNGKITWMRVASPVGTHIPHPDDARVMIKADLSKGEKGTHMIFSEGRDNDGDGKFNEDGAGGVWFNRNLSYKPPVFTQGSGEFPVSEPETRALLDLLYDAYNVYAVVSFGPDNNLSAPVPFNAAAAGQRLVAGYLEPDSKVNSMVSDIYNKTTGMKDAPKTTPGGGDFMSWGYFHFGRFSFSTPGWFVPKAKADSAKKEKTLSVDDPVANYLRFAAQQGINGTFTEWKPIQHPDFPGQQVEVGGIDPFVLMNPPIKLVPEITAKHTSFLIRLAGLQPQIDIINIRAEKLNNGLTRVTADIVNKGSLPTATALGERSYWLKRVNINLKLSTGQQLVSGKKVQLLNSLQPMESQQLTWLIKGTGTVALEAGAPTAGTSKTDIKL